MSKNTSSKERKILAFRSGELRFTKGKLTRFKNSNNNSRKRKTINNLKISPDSQILDLQKRNSFYREKEQKRASLWFNQFSQSITPQIKKSKGILTKMLNSRLNHKKSKKNITEEAPSGNINKFIIKTVNSSTVSPIASRRDRQKSEKNRSVELCPNQSEHTKSMEFKFKSIFTK